MKITPEALLLFTALVATPPALAAPEPFQLQGWTTVKIDERFKTMKEACREANRIAVSKLATQCKGLDGNLKGEPVKSLGPAEDGTCGVVAASVCVVDLE